MPVVPARVAVASVLDVKVNPTNNVLHGYFSVFQEQVRTSLGGLEEHGRLHAPDHGYGVIVKVAGSGRKKFVKFDF
jgi:hypothetical protein